MEGPPLSEAGSGFFRSYGADSWAKNNMKAACLVSCWHPRHTDTHSHILAKPQTRSAPAPTKEAGLAAARPLQVFRGHLPAARVFGGGWGCRGLGEKQKKTHLSAALIHARL